MSKDTKSLIIHLIILGFAFWLGMLAKKAMASEDMYLEDATGLYQYYDIFNGGVLLYRTPETEDLRLIDLNESTLMLINHGPPRNCLELILVPGDETQESYFIGCVDNVLVKTPPVKINEYGEVEEVEPDDLEDN